MVAGTTATGVTVVATGRIGTMVTGVIVVVTGMIVVVRGVMLVVSATVVAGTVVIGTLVLPQGPSLATSSSSNAFASDM
jgi:hypothetical protein